MSTRAMVMTDGVDAPVGPMGGLDAAPAGIEACLVDNGITDADLSLPALLARAREGFPAEGEPIEVLGFVLDEDPLDPVFVDAVAACEDLVNDTPGLAAFSPTDRLSSEGVRPDRDRATGQRPVVRHPRCAG